MPEPGKLGSVINCLLILTLLASCSGKSSVEDMDKETQNISSWVATANMVGDAWIRNVVPNNYAEQTLKRATEELRKEKDKIDKIKLSKDVTEHDKLLLLAEVLQLENKTEEVSRAVVQKNRSEVRQKLGELAAEERSLNKLKKSIRANQ
jgi:arginine/lysine/ornithine decarboxylase